MIGRSLRPPIRRHSSACTCCTPAGRVSLTSAEASEAAAHPTPAYGCGLARSELQLARRLDLRHRAHLGEHVGRQFAIDLDQGDGIATGRFATDMEGRDVDARVTKGGG